MLFRLLKYHKPGGKKKAAPVSVASPEVAGFTLSQSAIDASGLSKRELEVLQ